jgi:hypothetical protein
MSYTLDQLMSAREALGERNDCAVRAITAVTGADYFSVWIRFGKAGRVPCRGDYGQWKTVLRQLGFKRRLTKKFKSRTVRTLCRELPPTGRFLVKTRGHILGVVDREAIDWTRGRCHRVIHVWEVTQ